MSDPDVIVVGAGLAGLSCAWALSRSGLRVTACEASAVAGGRARSWNDPGTGDVVDIGPHIVLNKYANMLELLERLGTAGCIHWQTDKLLPSVSPREMLSNLRLAWSAMRLNETERFWARPWSPEEFNTDFYDLAAIRGYPAGAGSLIATNIIWSHRANGLTDDAITAATRRELAEFAPEAPSGAPDGVCRASHPHVDSLPASGHREPAARHHACARHVRRGRLDTHRAAVLHGRRGAFGLAGRRRPAAGAGPAATLRPTRAGPARAAGNLAEALT